MFKFIRKLLGRDVTVNHSIDVDVSDVDLDLELVNNNKWNEYAEWIDFTSMLKSEYKTQDRIKYLIAQGEEMHKIGKTNHALVIIEGTRWQNCVLRCSYWDAKKVALRSRKFKRWEPAILWLEKRIGVVE